jgi:ubiquitin-activating enzyme E1
VGFAAARRQEYAACASKGRGERRSLLASLLADVRAVRRVVDDVAASSMEACVAAALRTFYLWFRDTIASLTRRFPADAVTSTGQPFWSGTKRFPTAVAAYDPDNDTHVEFVTATANILAACMGIAPSPPQLLPADHVWRSRAFINGVVATLPVPPPEDVSVVMGSSGGSGGGDKAGAAAGGSGGLTDADLDAELAAEEAALQQLLATFDGAASTCHGRIVGPADFEKDEDGNFHMDFIAAASNLRASAYRIPAASRHECKMIAGRIIPAIATTTATVTGLVCLEMLKLVGGKERAAFRNCNLNLAVNTLQLFEPNPAQVLQGGTDAATQTELAPFRAEGFTKWFKIVVREPGLTVAQLRAVLKERHGVDVYQMQSAAAAELGRGIPLYPAGSAVRQ